MELLYIVPIVVYVLGIVTHCYVLEYLHVGIARDKRVRQGARTLWRLEIKTLNRQEDLKEEVVRP